MRNSNIQIGLPLFYLYFIEKLRRFGCNFSIRNKIIFVLSF